MTKNRRYSIAFWVYEISPVLCFYYEIEKDILFCYAPWQTPLNHECFELIRGNVLLPIKFTFPIDKS